MMLLGWMASKLLEEKAKESNRKLMEKDIILVDMDGVFCDFAKGYYDLAKSTDPELYSQLTNPKEQVNYYCHDHILDKEIWNRGDLLANHPDIFDMLVPYEGAIDGMKRLNQLANENNLTLLICTAPHTSNLRSYSAKAEWIKKHFGEEWLDKLMIVRDKTAVKGLILIDDKPIPLGNFVPEWKHVVMPHPYNLKQQKTNFVFGGWDDSSLNYVITYAKSVKKARKQ